HSAHDREADVLILRRLAEDPTAFEGAGQSFAAMLRPQGLERAKIAAARSYEVNANWKLVWENNRECWHCSPHHPQYIKANWDNAPIDDTRLRGEIEAHARATSPRLPAPPLTL